MLSIGDTAPDFELFDDQGEPVRLQALLAEGPFVLYFYPADFTPICTREACMYRDLHPRLVDAGVRVIGVSPQAAGSHAEFRQRHDLPFRLLADPERRVIRAYGAAGPLGLGVRRVSYLIDAQGRVADRAVADLRLSPHRALVERATTR